MLGILHRVDEFGDNHSLDVKCLHMDGQLYELHGMKAASPLMEMRNECGGLHRLVYGHIVA